MPERFRVELAPSQSITAIKSPRLDLCTRTVLERQEEPMVRFLQRRVYCEPVLPVLCFMCGPDEEAVRRSGRATAAGPCGDDADGQHLARRVEINAPHVPRFGNAEGGFKQLVLHPRALASMAECRTMPHSAELDCRVPRSPSRVRFAGLRPPLTAPAGPSLVARRLPKSARSPSAGPISHWRRLPCRLCFGLP